jgi:V/A-type H+/Na+-transporting ATPase subunit D
MPANLNISTTRSELQARKKQIELTRQGYNLLDKKRMALLQELLHMEDDMVGRAEGLQQAVLQARQVLAYSAAKSGPAAIRSAAMGQQKEMSLQMETRSVMGVKLPYIKSYELADVHSASASGDAYPSLGVKETAAAFRNEVAAILRLVESEMQFTRLLVEIRATTRRLKAIENIPLPNLESERNYIRMALEERERSDRNRLKIARDAQEVRQSAAP